MSDERARDLSLFYAQAFRRRVRQRVEVPGMEPCQVWCARLEDVIVGRLMA